MAQRCIMDAVEKRTSRNNQAGHRTRGRGHIASERKKNKTKTFLQQNDNLQSAIFLRSATCFFCLTEI